MTHNSLAGNPIFWGFVLSVEHSVKVIKIALIENNYKHRYWFSIEIF